MSKYPAHSIARAKWRVASISVLGVPGLGSAIKRVAPKNRAIHANATNKTAKFAAVACFINRSPSEFVKPTYRRGHDRRQRNRNGYLDYRLQSARCTKPA
jgi:hypothetical protein